MRHFNPFLNFVLFFSLMEEPTIAMSQDDASIVAQGKFSSYGPKHLVLTDKSNKEIFKTILRYISALNSYAEIRQDFMRKIKPPADICLETHERDMLAEMKLGAMLMGLKSTAEGQKKLKDFEDRNTECDQEFKNIITTLGIEDPFLSHPINFYIQVDKGMTTHFTLVDLLTSQKLQSAIWQIFQDNRKKFRAFFRENF